MDCSICCEPFTKSTRREVKCNHCQFSSCIACNKTYLLGSVHEPHCSSCRKTWSIEFMNDNLPKTFLKKEYRDNRELVYFKEEETHLPALQPFAEFRKNIDGLTDSIKAKNNEIKANDDNEDQFVRTQRETDRRLNKELESLEKKRRKELLKKAVVVEKRVVVMKCPVGECKGFLDSKFYCGLCNTHVCSDCHGNKGDDEHKCNKDDVATIKELNRTTKPCPSCHTRIFKTDGCDQMFCIQCHTAFSWTTGRVETGVIHNPHYLEELRAGKIQHQRHQPHQGGCGVMRDVHQVIAVYRDFCKNNQLVGEERNKISRSVEYFYQRLVHHRAVTLHEFTRVVDREDERINYLTGKLDEKKFKQRLYVHRKVSQRKLEEQQIVDNMVNTGEAIFREFSVDNVVDSILQLKNLMILYSEALQQIDKKYQHKGMVLLKEDLNIVFSY